MCSVTTVGLTAPREAVVVTKQACSPVMNERGERLFPNVIPLPGR